MIRKVALIQLCILLFFLQNIESQESFFDRYLQDCITVRYLLDDYLETENYALEELKEDALYSFLSLWFSEQKKIREQKNKKLEEIEIKYLRKKAEDTHDITDYHNQRLEEKLAVIDEREAIKKLNNEKIAELDDFFDNDSSTTVVSDFFTYHNIDICNYP